eukprot:TRINITY_DN69466_c0_g1_i1.p1 TRINITY_DN69466_c0_g1~~TRINITY_DN69466_c0_g1_i1.p1  ORF type:complete len:217 (+),score=57.50 TRINITY_DN69466_c0_g1_i1:58-651(+)
MAAAFAEKLGVEKDFFAKEMAQHRSAMQAELSAEFAKRESELQSQILQLKQQHEAGIKEQQRQTQLQNDELRREMAEKMRAKEQVLRDLQTADPADRKALQDQAATLKEELRHSQRKQSEREQLWQEQLADKERQLLALMRQLEARAAQVQRSRNYDFGQGRILLQNGCLHPRSRNWGNSHGSGRKCLDCRAELGRL